MMATMPMLAPSHTQNSSEEVPCRSFSATDSMPAVSTDQGRSAAGGSERWRLRGGMAKVSASPPPVPRAVQLSARPVSWLPDRRSPPPSQASSPVALGKELPGHSGGPAPDSHRLPDSPPPSRPSRRDPLGEDTLRRGVEASRQTSAKPVRLPILSADRCAQSYPSPSTAQTPRLGLAEVLAGPGARSDQE